MCKLEHIKPNCRKLKYGPYLSLLYLVQEERTRKVKMSRVYHRDKERKNINKTIR